MLFIFTNTRPLFSVTLKWGWVKNVYHPQNSKTTHFTPSKYFGFTPNKPLKFLFLSNSKKKLGRPCNVAYKNLLNFVMFVPWSFSMDKVHLRNIGLTKAFWLHSLTTLLYPSIWFPLLYPSVIATPFYIFCLHFLVIFLLKVSMG